MIRVMLLDDHSSTRMGVRMILESAGDIEIVASCATGEEALAAMEASRPDILVCDLYLPGLSGCEVIEHVRRSSMPVHIIVLSAQSDGPLPRRLLAAGVRGYMGKGAPPSELLRCVRAVASGERYVDAVVAQSIAIESYHPYGSSPFDKLTARELEVLLHILRGKRVHEIAASLAVSVKTVSAHKLNAMMKLGVGNLPAATRLALQHGVLDPIGASPS